MVPYSAGANIESFGGICGTTEFQSCRDVSDWFSSLVVLIAYLGFSSHVLIRPLFLLFVLLVFFRGVLAWGIVRISEVVLPRSSDGVPLAVI